jgi:GTP-binding protein
VSLSIQAQVEAAFATTDVVLFMLDARQGVTALDEHFAQWLRRRLGPGGPRGKKGEGAGAGAQAGADGADEHMRQEWRQKSVLLVANKTEGAHLSPQVLDTVADAARLGFGDPVLISAAHGDGLADLAQELIRLAGERGCRLEEVTKSAKRRLYSGSGGATAGAVGAVGAQGAQGAEAAGAVGALGEGEGEGMGAEGAEGVEQAVDGSGRGGKIALEERVVQMAIMGRPNVGKSTLLNAFLREERSITGPMPGLTRDAVHAEWLHKGRKFKYVLTC